MLGLRPCGAVVAGGCGSDVGVAGVVWVAGGENISVGVTGFQIRSGCVLGWLPVFCPALSQDIIFHVDTALVDSIEMLPVLLMVIGVQRLPRWILSLEGAFTAHRFIPRTSCFKHAPKNGGSLRECR